VKLPLGCLEQILPIVGPLLGEQRVSANDQALGGVVGMGDLGHVSSIENRQLDRIGFNQSPDLLTAV
jgi:hypothetical protein